MITVALCGLLKSKLVVETKISVFLGTSAIGYTISEFDSIKELVESNEYFDMYFVDKEMRESEELLFDYINKDQKTGTKKLRFITYIEDPVSDTTFDAAIDCIKRHIEYDSMYLAIEFLTDKGLRSIAISKIMYFEYTNRKIKIKTQNNEYYCDDTLRNILSLVSNYGFLQPHKSFIINLKYITDIKNYMIKMSDDSIIPLSQKKSKDFRQQYNEFLKKNHTQVKKRVKR